MAIWNWKAFTVSGLLAVFGGAAQADELRYALGLPSQHQAVVSAEAFAKEVGEATGGDLTVKVFPMSLLSLAESSEGLRDGLADIGLVLVAYTPRYYAHINFIADLNINLVLQDIPDNKGVLAFNGAMSEYLFLNCTECLDEFAAQNQVFLGLFNSDPEDLLCATRIEALADVAGKRIRSTRAGGIRLIEALGGTPVNMSANDLYTGLSQGALDCTINSVSQIRDLGVTDVVTHVTVGIPGTVYAGTSIANVNKDAWQGLSTEHRAVLVRAAAAHSARVVWTFFDGTNAALQRDATAPP